MQLDGSSDLQLVMNLKLRNNDESKYNILFRARFEKDNQGGFVPQVEDGIKQLYIDHGRLIFNIRGSGMIKGNMRINDARNHLVALRYEKVK